MKSRMLVSFLVIAVVASLIGGATMAWFTDTDSAGEATFTAGTLSLDVSDGLTTFAELSDIKIDCMNPGDVYPEIVITIVNDGTKNLAWFGDWSFTCTDETKTDALLDGIYIHSAKMQFFGPDETSTWEPEDQFIANGVGSGSYPQWYNTLAANPPFPVISLRDFDNNNGMGSAPWEHMGALKPGYSYKLTVQFGFYEGVGNEYQGNVASPVKISFKVDATQINDDALDGLQPGFSRHLDWLNAQIAKQQ